MKTDVKKVGKNKVKMKVEVPPADVSQALNRAAKIVAEQVKIPGFRQGKVPYAVLVQKVGVQTIVDEALRRELPIFYAKALSSAKVEPIASPDINVIKPMEQGKLFIFEATVEVKPEVALKNYKEIKVKKSKVAVTSQEIEAQVAMLREKFSELKDTLRITTQKGDFVLIDFNGTIDGKPFEGGSGSDFLLELGSQTFLKEFEDQLIGVKKGEEKTVIVHFPKDYAQKSLAGKTAYFKVKAKEIKQKVTPAYDDKFAEKTGFKNKKELEEDIKARIKEVKSFQADVSVRRQVINAATKQAKVDVPEVMVNDYTERLFSDLRENLARRGTSLEDYSRYASKSIEEIKKDVGKDAAIAAKSDLVFDAIAKKENISASEEEISKELEMIYARMGDDAKKFREGPEGTRREHLLRQALQEELIKRKTVDFLVENADYKEEKEEKKKKEKKGGDE